MILRVPFPSLHRKCWMRPKIAFDEITRTLHREITRFVRVIATEVESKLIRFVFPPSSFVVRTQVTRRVFLSFQVEFKRRRGKHKKPTHNSDQKS